MQYHVTPTLAVNPDGVDEFIEDPREAFERIIAGKKVVLDSWDDAYLMLRYVGLSPTEATRRLAFAATGDLYGTPPTVA